MTLIMAGWLITSPDEIPREKYGVRVLGNTVVDVGPNQNLMKNYQDDDVVDAKEHIVLPGFVNAHTHLYGVLAHGIAGGEKTFNWLGWLRVSRLSA